MNSALCSVFLLADRSQWEQMGRSFSGDGANVSMNEMLGMAAFGLGAVLLIWMLTRISRLEESQQTYSRPKWLFRQLSNAHRLTRQDRTALRKLAEFLELSQPAELFVQPENFEPQNYMPELKQYAGQLKRLRQRLFSE